MARRRMRNLRLWGTPFATPQAVVGWLGALQAQEFGVAKWSVAQRARGVTNAAMDAAYAEGSILRTHMLRPTWHFVLPEDIRWILEVSGPRVNHTSASRYRQLGLDEDTFRATNRALAAALEDGHRTRTELARDLEAAGISTDGQRLAHILLRAELDAIVCSGVPRGKQHTYALLDERAPHARRMDREEALAELTRRYFTARGPATIRDYRWWSSLTAAEAKRAIEMLGPELGRREIDGRTYWFAAGEPGSPRGSARIDLVQVYDEALMSYTESRDVVVGGAPVYDAFRLLHAILLDGRVVGLWKPVRGTEAVTLETTFDRALDPAGSSALETAARRFGRFMGLPVHLA
jgi:winged helix DNA-binding protein